MRREHRFTRDAGRVPQMTNVERIDWATRIDRRRFLQAGAVLGGAALLRLRTSAQSTVTIRVAASDATPAEKAAANFVCDGTRDDEEATAALEALPDAGG